MKKILYINCSCGISGDMMLASLLSAGVPAKYVDHKLRHLTEFGISKPFFVVCKTKKKHLPCMSVKIPGDFHFRSPGEIGSIIKKCGLSRNIQNTALGILEKLVYAESEVHGIPKSKIHFHEINSKDTLIDILGVSVALDYFQPDKIISSSVNLGRPNPATVEILKKNNVPVYSDEASFELTTPTGAAIITTIADEFGNLPPMTIKNCGFGLGSSDINSKDNILRIIFGEALELLTDEIYLIETNIDDMNPQIYPDVQKMFFDKGALDVWYENIIMKHGRPAIKLSVLCGEDNFQKISDAIFRETTTAGFRYIKMSRQMLKRKQYPARKKFYLPDGTTRIKTEYKAIRKKARNKNRPLKDFFK